MKNNEEKENKIKIGIPRAFLYFKYHILWETFFEELGIEYVISPNTNKEIITRGISRSIDESCLSSKIYIGHVDYLIEKENCDYIFIPRIATLGHNKEKVCTKFYAIYDVVNNTYRDKDLKLLDYSIDITNKETELKAFMQIGKTLGKNKAEVLKAYYIAKQADKTEKMIKINEQKQLMKDNTKTKILILAHTYNVYDEYIGKPILDTIKELGAVPIIGCNVSEKEAKEISKELTPTLPWTFNRELIGALSMYKNDVDGVILVSSFPCGPDSLVNEMIIRRFKSKPIITLTVDAQDGSAGMETRIESFIDIINFRKEKSDEEQRKKVEQV